MQISDSRDTHHNPIIVESRPQNPEIRAAATPAGDALVGPGLGFVPQAAK
jgi:hypothetical protein